MCSIRHANRQELVLARLLAGDHPHPQSGHGVAQICAVNRQRNGVVSRDFCPIVGVRSARQFELVEVPVPTARRGETCKEPRRSTRRRGEQIPATLRAWLQPPLRTTRQGRAAVDRVGTVPGQLNRRIRERNAPRGVQCQSFPVVARCRVERRSEFRRETELRRTDIERTEQRRRTLTDSRRRTGQPLQCRDLCLKGSNPPLLNW